ncbi:hypothetical protein AYI69_g6712 [Smittium culicis]|uniref:Chromo domain-containing protein n=1 Tax=Smittium culicis TaxID=133412 RepID=A0A1R1XXF5_9FUNG|nr:hypothetical protein AYI69_g6712 [Smittium culicis]
MHRTIEEYLKTLPDAEARSEELKSTHSSISNNLNHAIETFKANSDKNRKATSSFKINDMVWLNAKKIKNQRPSKKLGHSFLALFKIVGKINDFAYKIDIPGSLKIHPVFHYSLLGKLQEYTTTTRPQEPQYRYEAAAQEYLVDKILDIRFHYGRLQYLVQYEGSSQYDGSWEYSGKITEENLKGGFHNSYPGKPSPDSTPTPKKKKTSRDLITKTTPSTLIPRIRLMFNSTAAHLPQGGPPEAALAA